MHYNFPFLYHHHHHSSYSQDFPMAFPYPQLPSGITKKPASLLNAAVFFLAFLFVFFFFFQLLFHSALCFVDHVETEAQALHLCFPLRFSHWTPRNWTGQLKTLGGSGASGELWALPHWSSVSSARCRALCGCQCVPAGWIFPGPHPPTPITVTFEKHTWDPIIALHKTSSWLPTTLELQADLLMPHQALHAFPLHLLWFFFIRLMPCLLFPFVYLGDSLSLGYTSSCCARSPTNSPDHQGLLFLSFSYSF